MSDLIPFVGAALPATQSARGLAKIEAATQRRVAIERGRARVIEERHRASIQVVEAVASEALFAGASLTRHASILAQSVPGSEHLSGRVLDAASAAMAQVLTDTARDLRS